jgi:hypothetical protein
VVLAGTGITLAFAGTFVLGDTYTFSTSWISSSGTDEETDEALRARCKARWPSLGVAPTVDVYDLWARTASPTITKTRAVPSPTIPGQVDLYLATAAGVTPGADVTAVADYVAAREPLTMTSNVQSACVGAIAVQATLYVENGRQGTAAVEAEAALEALVAGLDIGGTLYLSELSAALTTPAGVAPRRGDLPGGRRGSRGRRRWPRSARRRCSTWSRYELPQLPDAVGGPHLAAAPDLGQVRGRHRHGRRRRRAARPGRGQGSLCQRRPPPTRSRPSPASACMPPGSPYAGGVSRWRPPPASGHGIAGRLDHLGERPAAA